jgi:hypothetical protein
MFTNLWSLQHCLPCPSASRLLFQLRKPSLITAYETSPQIILLKAGTTAEAMHLIEMEGDTREERAIIWVYNGNKNVCTEIDGDDDNRSLAGG